MRVTTFLEDGYADGPLAFGPDGKVIVSLGDGRITIWDPATGFKKGVLPGQAGTVKSLAFSPDGATLASAARASRRPTRRSISPARSCGSPACTSRG